MCTCGYGQEGGREGGVEKGEREREMEGEKERERAVYKTVECWVLSTSRQEAIKFHSCCDASM